MAEKSEMPPPPPPQVTQPQPAAAGAPIATQPMAAGAQPGPAGWEGSAKSGFSVPLGLEYLTNVDQLLIKQKVEMIETFTGFETNNKYQVLNSMGQRVYMAVEDTCCCFRCCCGSKRPFDIKLLDNQQKVVMHLERPLRCECCLFFCCLQKLVVHAPPGTRIGSVHQAWSCCFPEYNIKDAVNKTVLRVKGPCFRCNICGDIEFKVTTPIDGKKVGQITKQWSGLAKEIFTDADNFGVNFPLDLNVMTKATLLGSVFLIDFMYFENDKKEVKKEFDHLART